MLKVREKLIRSSKALGGVLKTSFFVNLIHKVKTQRSLELFVKNMLIFNVVVIKKYKEKKILKQISGKI